MFQKAASRHNSTLDRSATTWPDEGIHVFCLHSSWKCLEISRLGMGVGRIWAVDRPCPAPSPGQYNHGQIHKSTQNSRLTEMLRVYTKMDCPWDRQLIQSFHKSGHQPSSKIISTSTAGDGFRSSCEQGLSRHPLQVLSSLRGVFKCPPTRSCAARRWL